MRKFIPLLFLSLFIITSALYSQTGKITGTVTDEKTREPLIGVNVIVEGTSLGAATDVDGYYVILNVPPGQKSIRVSYIGYTSKTVTNVIVNIDQTTIIDIELSEQTIETQEVIVTAAKIPIVERDVSASRANISSAEIENLPTVNVNRVLGLQAGVQATDEGVEVRGGDIKETAYIVNGLSMRDERDNKPYTGISVTAIENIQVTTGGFSAEYGDLRSGLVNIVTREGYKDRYNFSLIGRYKPALQKHFGISPHDANSYWIRPYVDDAVAWTGTKSGAWNEFTQIQYPEFEGWNSISEKTLANNDPNDPSTYQDDLSPEAAQRLFLWQHRRQLDIQDPDYEVDMSFGGPVPVIGKSLGDLRFHASYRQANEQYLVPLSKDAYQDWSAQVKLTSDLSPGMKLLIDGLYGITNGTNDNNGGAPGVFKSAPSIARALNQVSYIDTRMFATDYWAPSEITHMNIGAKFTHVVSPTTFYEVIVSRFSSEYSTNPARPRYWEVTDPVTGEVKMVTDTSAGIYIGGHFYDEAPYGYQPSPAFGIGSGMRTGVGMSNSRDSSEVDVYKAKFDLITQLDKYNQVKAGLEITYSNNRTNYASVDQFLPQGRYQSKWNAEPLRAALYLRDILEFEGMVANVGFRLEYFDPGGEWWIYEPWTQYFKGEFSDNMGLYLEETATTKQLTVSPRLGISFPISVNSKLFFNYGHQRDFPTPENLYMLRRDTFDGRVLWIANPNNPLEKTVQYELGYEHNLFDMFLLRIAGYYKDVTLQQLTIQYVNRNQDLNYNVSEPNSYADIRGFEITLSKNRGLWFQGFINYTYDVRTSGRFGFRYRYENPAIQRDYERTTTDNEQFKPIPRPYARANMNFFTPYDFGPELGGIYPFGDWRLSMIGDWNNGFYFTWTGGGSIPGIIYNVQWNDTWNVDLRLSKSFRIAEMVNVEFLMDFTNVFNFKNMSSAYGFFDGKDYEAYMKSLHLPGKIGKELETSYINIPGHDNPGDYRLAGDFQPIVPVVDINNLRVSDIKDGAIYWERNSQNYFEYTGSEWRKVDDQKMYKVLKNKQYIDMPNQAFFTFLNPRQIYFGFKVSFELF